MTTETPFPTHIAPDPEPEPSVAVDVALTTGWEPDLELDDSMLRRFVFHHADALAAPAEATAGRVLRTDDFTMAELGPGADVYNSAVLTRPPTDRIDEVVGQVERFFDAGAGDGWLWSPWPIPDLSHRGWKLEGHPPFLLRPAGSIPPRRAPHITLTTVADGAGMAAWERIVVEGYPIRSMLPFRPGRLFDPAMLADDRYRFFVATCDGDPVGAAASFVAHGMASLAMGVTLPSARRRGVWDVLARHRIARHQHLPIGGIFSDMSRPGAERLGFLPISRWTLWTRPPTSNHRRTEGQTT